MRVFGIDPGSERTGYGCVETDGHRHRLVLCGALQAPARATFPERLRLIHDGLTELLRDCRPDLVAIENLFHAVNARSALKLGHARGVAMLAAVASHQKGFQTWGVKQAELRPNLALLVHLGVTGRKPTK